MYQNLPAYVAWQGHGKQGITLPDSLQTSRQFTLLNAS